MGEREVASGIENDDCLCDLACEPRFVAVVATRLRERSLRFGTAFNSAINFGAFV